MKLGNINQINQSSFISPTGQSSTNQHPPNFNLSSGNFVQTTFSSALQPFYTNPHHHQQQPGFSNQLINFQPSYTSGSSNKLVRASSAQPYHHYGSGRYHYPGHNFYHQHHQQQHLLMNETTFADRLSYGGGSVAGNYISSNSQPQSPDISRTRSNYSKYSCKDFRNSRNLE